MTETRPVRRLAPREAGYTLVEMLISIAILMVVSGFVLQAVIDMRRLSDQQANRSEMHGGVRNATALLQQEVGQAGRMAFPAPVTLPDGVPGPGTYAVNASSTASMFAGVRLVVGTGDDQEIVAVQNLSGNQITATFLNAHPAGTPVVPAGGFAEGIVPTTRADGSSPSVLKIVGDINGDGQIAYVEYTCDWDEGRLYRNMMAFDAGSKPALTVEQVLLDNLLPNPPDPDGNDAPCFRYEQRTISGRTYVINVAIMTTVRTHDVDPVTRQFQTVTKALLNVAPRNVFQVWQMASLGHGERVQPLPASIDALLE